MRFNKFKNTARLITAVASMALFSNMAQADDFPSKPIKLISGYPAGDLTDTVARLYADRLSSELDTPVIVENKPGAGQRLAIQTLTTSDPDGYTLLIGTGSALAQGPAARKNFHFGYDPREDFTFVGPIGNLMGVVTVNPDIPVDSIQGLVKHAHEHPGDLMFGSSGVGGAGHLLGEYFSSATNSDMMHVPFNGSADALRAVAAGDAQVAFTPLGNALPMIKAGQLKALLVLSNSQKVSLLPDVPTLATVDIDGLKGLYPYSFFAVVGPKGMDPAVAETLHDAIMKISSKPDIEKRLTKTFYIEPSSGSLDQFRTFIRNEYNKWDKLGSEMAANN